LLTLNLLEDELAFDDIFCVTGGIVSINAVDIVVISKNKSSTKLVINLFNVVIRIFYLIVIKKQKIVYAKITEKYCVVLCNVIKYQTV